MKRKKYRCPNCKNDDHEELSACQKAWVALDIQESDDGTHILEDPRPTEAYVGRVDLDCHLCEHQWAQKEITT